jgi:hypothetical protein
MFKMRAEHREAFRRAALEDFEERAIANLRNRLPEQASGVSTDAFRARVRKGLTRAAAYDLTTEFEVVTFIEAELLLGDRFDTDPRNLPVHLILKNKTLKPSRKAEWLLTFAESMARSRALAATDVSIGK